MRIKEIYSFVFCALGYLLLVFILYPGLFLDFSNKVPFGDHGDVQNILSVINYSIHTNLSNIYHLPFLYPISYVLARTHPLFGISLFIKIFESFGLNLEASVNLYIILSLVIGALGCYLLTKELSKNRILAIVFSSLYIVYFHNGTFLHWLNFLSYFYFPYCLYFFIRYFKTEKRKYIIWFTLFAVFQFLASVYYGIHLWAFLIPSVLILALILRIVSLRNFKNAVVGLSVGFVSLIIIFFPFLITQQSLEKDADPIVLNAADLFSHNVLLNLFLVPSDLKSAQFFPGYTIFIFVLYYLASLVEDKNKKVALFIALFILFSSMTYLVYVNVLILEYVLLFFLLGILFLVANIWKSLDKWECMMLLTFSLFLILLFQFTTINFLRSISIYKLFSSLLPFSGLKVIRRVYPIVLPLLIVLANFGGNKLLESFKTVTKKKVIVVASIVLVFMILENLPYRHPIFQRHIMKDLPTKETFVYKMLPFRENKIILEIPYYFQTKAKNSRYVLNWECHQNYLLNGKASIKPHTYYRDLVNIIGSTQKVFPNENKLIKLIQKYSITHIIFHWDLLKDYQRDPKARERTMQKIYSAQKYGKVLYDDDKNTLVRVQEFVPIKRIIRTFSLFHLRNNLINIKLEEKYMGRIMIYLNDRLIGKRDLNDEIIVCNFKNEDLNMAGNRIEIIFENPILMEDIYLSEHKNR